MEHIRVCNFDVYLKGYEDGKQFSYEDGKQFSYINDIKKDKMKFWEKGYEDCINKNPRMSMEKFYEWIKTGSAL